MYNKGEIITIYKDPMTRQKEEGEAKIVKQLSSSPSWERYKVEFIDEPGQLYERWVYVADVYNVDYQY